ncbi:hypothetical protein [Burkholderia pseudomallei]|uniref:hypothetical protein n=1 Tax=Burkholderia pseudomallei TaxID=28450 RepID=UPI001E41F803|nr:hypothetical protein [Burkholderia pseudomallei]
MAGLRSTAIAGPSRGRNGGISLFLSVIAVLILPFGLARRCVRAARMADLVTPFAHGARVRARFPKTFKHCQIFRNSDYSDSNNYVGHSSSIQLYFRCNRGAILK